MNVLTSKPVDRALKRLEKEFENLRADPIEGCSAQPKDENLFEWTGMIQGPKASPYAAGTFRLVVHFPEDYPHKPPTVTFVTKIYHPNIDSDSGFVGLSILNRDWCPALTISTILLSLRAFLGDPDPTDAVVPEVAHEYEAKRSVYEETARQWTEKFAKNTA
jgi:ubiquitin-conjugating enzyme E2 D/E